MSSDAIIAMISACIAVVSTIVGVLQNRRNWYISSISIQRLEWAENLRNALCEFVCAYYDKRDLHPHYNKIVLYLNPNNSMHKDLFKKLQYITFASKFLNFNDNDIDDLIVKAQKLLRYNWRTVKTESTISFREERWRDKKIRKRIKYYEERENKNKI